MKNVIGDVNKIVSTQMTDLKYLFFNERRCEAPKSIINSIMVKTSIGIEIPVNELNSYEPFIKINMEDSSNKNHAIYLITSVFIFYNIFPNS